MATYDSLTDEQKDILQYYMNHVRDWCGTQGRINHIAEAINDDYNAQASAIISSLDANEVIPDTSQLDGTVAITKEELISITAHIQGVLTNYNTTAVRQLWTKAAGARRMTS